MHHDTAKMIGWYAKNRLNHRLLADSVSSLLERYLGAGAVQYARVEPVVRDYNAIRDEVERTNADPSSFSDMSIVRVLVYDSEQMKATESVIRGLFDIISESGDEESRSYVAMFTPTRLVLPEYQKFAKMHFSIITQQLIPYAYDETIAYFESLVRPENSDEFEKRKAILSGIIELAKRELDSMAHTIYPAHYDLDEHEKVDVPVREKKLFRVRPHSAEPFVEDIRRETKPPVKEAQGYPAYVAPRAESDERPKTYMEEPSAGTFSVEVESSPIIIDKDPEEFVPAQGTYPKKSKFINSAEPLTSATLRDYLTVKFESLPYMDRRFGKNDSTVLLKELYNMEISTVGELDAIVPQDFLESNRLYEHRTNFTGIVRQIMMVYDAERYFRDAWDRHWDVFVFKSKNEHDLFEHYHVDIAEYAKTFDFEVQYAYLASTD